MSRAAQRLKRSSVLVRLIRVFVKHRENHVQSFSFVVKFVLKDFGNIDMIWISRSLQRFNDEELSRKVGRSGSS